jgi:hypothetical protein
LRTSLYADDAAIFVAPIKHDIQNLAVILQCFGNITGLYTNFTKSSVVPIRCQNIDLDDVLEGISATRASFSLRYLGLPLSVWCLRRRDYQHLEDKCAARIPTWNGKYVTLAGRTALVKSVIASQAIYHLTPLSIPPGTLKFINKLERAFLWAAKDSTTGAKCIVNWEVVCRPKNYGGLGVLNVDKFATTLRLRWPWLDWKCPDKILVGSGNPCGKKDLDIFCAATTITVGNGAKTPFWHAPWVDGRAPIDIAPLIFESSKRKKCTVSQAITEGAWMRNINALETFTWDHITQFIELWILVCNVELHVEVEDEITWNLTENGQYSASSAYEAQFLGLVNSVMYSMVWKAWAPPKAKHHAWLTLQNRLWTADRLQKRGWPSCGLCPLCKQVTESTNHLFVHCRFTFRVWELLKEWLGIHGIHPRQWAGLSINEWWPLLASSARR